MRMKNDQQLKQLCTQYPLLSNYLVDLQTEYQSSISMMLHEIKNPLTFIYSTIQLMSSKEHLDTEDYKLLLQDVKKLCELVNEYSEFQQSNKIQKKRTNFSSLVEEVIQSIKPFASEKQIFLSYSTTKVYESFPSTIFCDGNKLKQVFSNIIKNGIEVTPINGTIRIELDLQQAQETIVSDCYTHYFIVVISNSHKNNPISPEQMEHIFEPFVTYKKNGTGLGLAICKQIVESHSGYIHAYSDETETKFCIQIPCCTTKL